MVVPHSEQNLSFEDAFDPQVGQVLEKLPAATEYETVFPVWVGATFWSIVCIGVDSAIDFLFDFFAGGPKIMLMTAPPKIHIRMATATGLHPYKFPEPKIPQKKKIKAIVFHKLLNR